MQPKKAPLPKKTPALPSAAGEGAPRPGAASPPLHQRRVGRPPTSPHDRKTQVRENVRAYRAKLKAAGLVKTETFLPIAWHKFLNETGQTLQDLGVEAFTLLLRQRGASALVDATELPPAAP